jgi:hypothetical protein
VKKLHLNVKEELKTASNYNTRRNESFLADIANMKAKNLDVTPEKISCLLDNFADEVVAVFSSAVLEKELWSRHTNSANSITALR